MWTVCVYPGLGCSVNTCETHILRKEASVCVVIWGNVRVTGSVLMDTYVFDRVIYVLVTDTSVVTYRDYVTP